MLIFFGNYGLMVNDVVLLFFGFMLIMGGMLLYNYGDNVVFVLFWDLYFIRDFSIFNLLNILFLLFFFSDLFVYLMEELDLFLLNSDFDDFF